MNQENTIKFEQRNRYYNIFLHLKKKTLTRGFKLIRLKILSKKLKVNL